METLSYGVKKPETGDRGSVWFPALADNCDWMADHTHNGANSPKLSGPVSAAVVTQTILAAAWVATADGTYRQLVTMSGSLLYAEVALSFKLSTGDVIYPTVERVSTNTFYVYTNDNTLTYTAVYSA